MRTNEERSRLIHKRTAEIKREKRNRLQRGLDAVCIAVCLLFGYRYRGMDAGTDDRTCGRKHCSFFGERQV